MVHILLMILKIIGILLLIILAIALALVLALLFVPLRYRLKADYHGTPRGYAGVSWLLHLLTYRAEYGEAGVVQKVKICGICLWRSDKSREAADEAVETVLSDEEQALYEEMRADDEERYGALSAQEIGRPEDNTGAETAPEFGTGTIQQTDDGDSGKCGKKSGEARASKDHFRTEAQGDPEPETASRAGLFSRVISKIKGILQKLRFSFRAFCDKLKSVREMACTVREWIGDEKNKASVRLLLRQAKRLLKHVLPRKGHAQVTFGFDDPSVTGQVLTFLSPFYPLYGRVLELHPVFDRSVLCGEADIRGRIRLASLLWLCFAVYRDKHTWNLIRKLRR
ncbi:hypothetical protein [Enterocloster asparagiformis]|uniref:hypothetical protein n=1 Tax=Enterocloster asparagiformis TaxID=333367 RepID=UPI002A81ECA0|nr:hypothetical protein [Enterocloster asparagiformis]